MAVDFQPLTITPVDFSLTAGTNIPAPPDSPPQTPVKTNLPTLEEEKDENSDPAPESTPDSKAEPPLSPTSANSNGSQKRVSGVRKFLSLRSLRGDSRHREGSLASPNGSKLSHDTGSRPGSPYTTMSTDTTQSGGLKHRKSTGWFGSTSKRKSGMFVIGRLDERIAEGQNAQKPAEAKVPKGPPPPTIPEFELGKDLEMGADDLFKDIKG